MCMVWATNKLNTQPHILCGQTTKTNLDWSEFLIKYAII